LVNDAFVAKLSAQERKLKRAIKRSLRDQGFQLDGNRLTFRQRKDKRSIRNRHRLAVLKKITLASKALAPDEAELVMEKNWPD
jgi:hypothetical protein